MNNNNTRSYIIFVIFIAALGFLIFNNGSFQKTKIEHTKYVIIAGLKLNVELAITPSELEQGLSGRSGISENQGMLFIFDKPGKYLFWMKNMNFPIDIIWIGEDMRVIYIKKNAAPDSYLETYGPDSSYKDAKYVLEVVSGFSEKNNLKEGDQVEFTHTLD